MRVGYVPERPAVWPLLSVREHLAAAARCATVLLSSHYLVELERVSDRMGVMHRGRLVLDEPLGALLLRRRTRVEVELDRDPGEALEEILRLGCVLRVEGWRLEFRDLDDERYFRLMSTLLGRGLRVLRLGHPGSLLEQVFLEAVGRDER